MSDKARQENGLPAGWVWTTIGEITQPVEKTEPASRPDEEFTYLDISSIDNAANVITDPKFYFGKDAPSRARQLVFTEDVLFSTVRTYLKNIALVPEKYDGQVASTGFCVLRGKKGISGKYLFFYSLTHDFLEELGKLQRGVSYPAVRDQDVRNQRVPLAPTAEQHRIVAEIETQFTRLDAGVAALRRVQANLRRYKASVLKAACEGRLVLTEAELACVEGREFEPASVLLERILAERRAKWEQANPGKRYVEPKEPEVDGLAELPEGWIWATMEQLIADFRSGSTAVPQDNVTPFPILRSSSVRPLHVDLSDVRYLHANNRTVPENYLQEGDLLYTRLSGSLDYVGNCALVFDIDEERIQYPDRIFRAKLSKREMGRYLQIHFASPPIRKQIMARAKSTAGHQRISMGAIREQSIALPPIPEQHRIVAEVERRLSVVQEVEATIAANLKRAERLRQSILKRAFEGKLVPQDPSDEPASALLERIRSSV